MLAHDEITAVDLGHSVRVAGGRLKPRVLCCLGAGFLEGMVDAPWVTPCWCPAGLRMQSALPPESWPLTKMDARALAKRLGLKAKKGARGK